jgi:hypothetical protein
MPSQWRVSCAPPRAPVRCGKRRPAAGIQNDSGLAQGSAGASGAPPDRLARRSPPRGAGHMVIYIARRNLLATLLGGAVAWPLGAQAQQPKRPDHRRIGYWQTSARNMLAGVPAGIARSGLHDASAPARRRVGSVGWVEHRQIRLDGEATQTKISAVRVKSRTNLRPLSPWRDKPTTRPRG